MRVLNVKKIDKATKATLETSSRRFKSTKEMNSYIKANGAKMVKGTVVIEIDKEGMK